MRDKLLHDKRVELEEVLTRWAKDNDILASGEQLAFTLRIIAIPTVVEEVSNSLDASVLDLTMEKFFTRVRLETAGARKDQAIVSMHALWNVTGKEATVREFLQIVYDEEAAFSIHNMGETRLRRILPILRELWALNQSHG